MSGGVQPRRSAVFAARRGWVFGAGDLGAEARRLGWEPMETPRVSRSATSRDESSAELLRLLAQNLEPLDRKDLAALSDTAAILSKLEEER